MIWARARARTTSVVVLVIVAAFQLWISSMSPARAITNRPVRRSSAETIVGVLASVTPHRVTIESTAGGAVRGYRIDVLTTVCYEPNLCLGSGNTRPLLPGATVTAHVATDKHGMAHASTIFVTSVAATIRIDSVDGDVITGRSTRSGAPFTILRRPFTIIVDAEHGEVRGGVPNLEIGGVLYFTGLAGLENGSPVTIAARLFP